MIDPLFNEYCEAALSAAFDPEYAPAENQSIRVAAMVMDTWVKRFRGSFPKVPSLCAGFIENVDFGAAADIWNNTAVIRVHASVPTMLANLVDVVLSHPNALEIHSGRVDVHPDGIRLDRDTLLERLFNNGHTFQTGRGALISVALCNFLIFHEFVHIRDGHVDLFKQAVGFLAMEETTSHTSEKLSPLDRQAMEWDADKIAHWLSTDVALSTMLGKPFVEVAVEKRREAFWVYHVFLYLLFKLVEAAEPKNAISRVHPTPAVRMGFILTSMKPLAEMLHIGPVPDHIPGEVLRTGEVAWALISGVDVVPIVAKCQSLESQVEDAVAILRQWNILRERLAPFNRGASELAHPNPD